MTSPIGRSSIGVRVRPNSHDFIRLLAADLKTKHYTFYVDVGAKTTQATKDVRAWARTTLPTLTANVSVGAKMTEANKTVAAWRQKEKKIATVIPVRADTSGATANVAAWRAHQESNAVTIKVKVKITDAMLADNVAIQRAVQKAVGTPKGTGKAKASDVLKVSPDGGLLKINPAAEVRKVKKAKDDLQAAAKMMGPLTFEVEADPKSRQKMARDVNSLLGELGSDRKISAKLDLNTKPAARSFKDVLANINASTATGKLKLNTAPATQAFTQVMSTINNSAATAKLNLNTGPAAAAAKTAKMRIAKDPVKAQLDLDLKRARLDYLLLRQEIARRKLEVKVQVKRSGLDRLGDSLSKLEKGFGGTSLLRSLDVGPFNLGKPTGLVGTMTTITAMAGLVPGVVTGVMALSDAFMRLAGAAAIVPGAIAAIGTSLSVFSIATIGVGDAVSAMFDMWNEGASEKASTDRRSVQAHSQLRKAVHDEAKAQRDVADARKEATHELRDLNNELRGAVLNEAQAILDVQKARDEYAQGDFENETDRLQQQLNIRQAEQALIDVREKNISLAEKAQKGNEQGVEGSDRVTDALERQADATDRIAIAQEAIESSQATGAAGKFADALGLISPNAQDFVMAISDLRGELGQFKTSLQELVFANLGDGFKEAMATLIPVAKPGMEAVAKEMNRTLMQVFESLASPDGQLIITRILGGTEKMQQAITSLIDPLIRSFGVLAAAGAEHMPQLVDLVSQLTERFAAFIEEADKNGTLDEFLDKGVEALGYVAEISINLFKIVNDLGKAFGGNLLKSLSEMTAEWHKFLSSPEGQAKLKGFLEDATELWKSWKPIFQQLPGIFDKVQAAAQNLLTVVLPFVDKLVWALDKFPGLITAFITVWGGAKIFVGLVSPLLRVIELTTSFLGLMLKIPGVAAALKAIGVLSPNWTPPGTTPPVTPVPTPPGGAPTAPIPVAGPAGVAGKFAAAIGPRILGAGVGPGASSDVINLKEGMTPEEVAAFDAAMQRRDLDEADRIASIADQRNQAAKPWWQRILGWETGGYTAWPQQSGHLAVLHGKEYVQPADTVGHYGVDAMKAVHEKRAAISFQGGGVMPAMNPNWEQHDISPWGVYPQRSGTEEGIWGPDGMPIGTIPDSARAGSAPGPGKYESIPGNTSWAPTLPGSPPVEGGFGGRGSFNGTIWDWLKLPPGMRGHYKGGYIPSYEGGGLDDPNDPRHKNPYDTSIIDSAIQHGVSGATNVVSGAVDQAQQATPGQGTGPLPGPADAVSPTAPATTPITAGIFGMQFPLGSVNSGWPGGQAPIGLGGGEGTTDPVTGKVTPPLDIRNFGFGPGPAGSTPSDWATWGANFGAETISKFGEALLRGGLGFFGLEGLLDNPYVSAGKTLLGHFAEAGSKSKAQGEGAGQTNSDINSLLNTYDNMALNPAYPGIPDLPANLFDPGSGSAITSGGQGLQINTLRGLQIIQAHAPWATNIGGVRPDAKKWHPSGLALDVMTDPGHSNNQPPSPEGLAKGNELYHWLKANQAALGIDYIMWGPITGDADHYNHLHVNFSPSGYPDGSTPLTFQGPGLNPATGMPATKTPITPVAPPKPAAAPKDLKDLLFPEHVRDGGGWLPTGTSIVHNNTGTPEYVVPRNLLRGFQGGGYNFPTGIVPAVPLPPPPPPPKPLPPRGPDINLINPPPPAPRAAPKPQIPAITPTAPPVVQAPTPGAGVEPSPSSPAFAPSDRPVTGTEPGAGDHVHPALRKGITSGFATAGALAQQAASFGMMAASGGASAAGGGGGGMGGAGGISISGLFQQGGKIATNVANVASSFLVGNITGGTTENPYGVTQRESNPTGGSRVVDASQNQYGDVYTNNLDEYFALKERKERQRSQATLGRWGNA